MRFSGLDVHKDTIFASVSDDGIHYDRKVYETDTGSLYELRDWLLSLGVESVGMESTGIYWQVVESILGEKLQTYVVNANYVRQVPGKKTDQNDADWLCKLLSKGLLPSSFIVRGLQSQLRILTRHRKLQLRRRTDLLVQISNLLDRCNIRLRRLVSSLSSKGSMRLIRALSRGETDPHDLQMYLHGRTLKRHGEAQVLRVLRGHMKAEDCFVLSQLLGQYDLLEQQIKHLEHEAEDLAQREYGQEMELLMSLPGVGMLSSIHILAEAGADMSVFKGAKQLSSWAGLCPRNDESAGKLKSRRLKPGNSHLRPIMVQCALAAIRTRGSHFVNYYANLSARMNKKKAVIAVARKLICLVYILLERKQKYRYAA